MENTLKQSNMKAKDLRLKRALRTALLVLLLSAAGMGKMYAQSFTVGDLNYQVNNDGVSVTVTGHVDGQTATGSLVIPETVEHNGSTYTVNMIGNYAFSGCNGFTGGLSIPNSVTSIEYGAFSGCSGLTGDLNIPNSVISISGSSMCFHGLVYHCFSALNNIPLYGCTTVYSYYFHKSTILKL